jgi:hypothetical protein
MITIFNRKELVSTFSMKRQSEIRKELQRIGINYKCKVINRNSASPFSDSRVRTGSLGQNMDMAYEYIFYVCKQDYDRAKEAI